MFCMDQASLIFVNAAKKLTILPVWNHPGVVNLRGRRLSCAVIVTPLLMLEYLEGDMADSKGGVDAVNKRGGLNQTDRWIAEQDELKEKLVMLNDFPWRLQVEPSLSEDSDGMVETSSKLRYVGGVDLSFAKEDSSFACGALVVIDLESMQVVYEDFDVVQLTMPYVAGFLAFRETPVLLALLKKMAAKAPLLYPQLLMVDGNGILHPRGFGLASHLGVLADIPTIGIGKNLHHIDGLTNLEVRQVVSESNLPAGAGMPLIGSTGQVWGMAFRSHDGCSKPVFISVGHRISLDTAVEVVRRCCLHRVPEPVRQVGHFRVHVLCYPTADVFVTEWNSLLDGVQAVVSTLGMLGPNDQIEKINGDANIIAVNAAKKADLFCGGPWREMKGIVLLVRHSRVHLVSSAVTVLL